MGGVAHGGGVDREEMVSAWGGSWVERSEWIPETKEVHGLCPSPRSPRLL